MKAIVVVLMFWSVIGLSFKVSETDTSLSKLVAACNEAISEFPEYFACPKITKYTLKLSEGEKKLRESSIVSYFNGKLDANFQSTTPTKAVTAVLSRVRDYLSALSEVRPELETEDLERLDEAADRYSSAMDAIKSALGRASKKSNAYLDADMYWARSVNASGMVIIDKKSASVIAVLLGDLDG